MRYILSISMCMQNFITTCHSVQEIAPLSLFQNLELGKASTNEKCHFAISWARSCQYQCLRSSFQEVGEVTQYLMFYPRQDMFWRYQVFHHKINLFQVTRHFLCFICSLFHLKWTNAFKHCYYHPTPWEDLKSYLPFEMTDFTLLDFITKHTSCAWWETIHGTMLNTYRLYIFKTYTLWHSVFLRIINAFPCVLKDVDIIFVVLNALELTNSDNFRMLSLPYYSL